MTDSQSTHGHDCWGWGPRHYECAVREIERLAAQLTVAQQPAGDGCHCGTCTCNPNMTPAVRFDLSPAQMEGAIRDHLIRLGWTPPDEPAVSQQPEERGGGAAEPPSAPAGVDFAAVASILRRAMRDGVHYGYRREFILQQALALEALSQRPPSAPVGVEDMQRRLDREESEHGRTIDQRDAAEDALGRMFQAVTGRPAEWSSAWGYVDAIEEVEEHVAALEAAREDAKKYRWALNNSCWIRGEHAAYVAIPVACDADLSCVAMRDTAIDQARGEAGGEVEGG